jgi:hypothetical protein
MNGHLSAQLIERYRQRALPPAELLDADDHLAACDICRQSLVDEQRAQAAVRSLRRDLEAAGLTHLSYEQLVSYVEGSLDQTDREIADSHLKLCAQCSAELDGLRAFAAEMDAYPAGEYASKTSLSPGEKLLSSAKGLWGGAEGFWRSPVLWLPVRIAGLGLVIALLLWAAVLKSRNSQLQTALDGERRENEKLKQGYQAASASVIELQNQLAQLRSAGLPSSSIVATLNDGGGQVTLDKEGNVTGAPPEYQQAVRQTLIAQQIGTSPALSELIGKSGALMGPADEGHPIALLSPVGTVVISDRPTFRWRALDGADGYVVKIYDADFNEVAVSPRLSRTVWTATRSLERGRIYSWQVIARVADREVISPIKPAPDAKFMALNQAKANELANARNAAAGSRLTLGILYAQAGLLDDAERELQALVRANPQSTLARKLLDSLRAKRRPSQNRN